MPMKLVTATNKVKSLQISRAEWLRIGSIAGWTKTAQPVPEIITEDEILAIVESMGTTRFSIGYRKKDGTFRNMSVQRKVNKYRENEGSAPGYRETREEHGLILLYDLVAAKKALKTLVRPEGQSDEDYAAAREYVLRRAQRSIYPNKIEMIKGRGQTWIVDTAESPDIQRMIVDTMNRIAAAQELVKLAKELTAGATFTGKDAIKDACIKYLEASRRADESYENHTPTVNARQRAVKTRAFKRFRALWKGTEGEMLDYIRKVDKELKNKEFTR